MDLNSVKLSSYLIEELYGNQLVQLNTKAGKAAIADPMQSQVSSWNYLGKNQKQVLIILSNPGIPFLPDADLEFLSTILKACKLGLDDVAILNIANYESAGHKELFVFFKSRIVLLFDVEPAAFGLPMNFPQYQIQPFAGNSFLYAPSLRILEKEIEEKKKLWTCLKRLFNL